MGDALTEREKWLMKQAFKMGFDRNAGYEYLDEWLSDIAADGGVTVEMVLAKETP